MIARGWNSVTKAVKEIFQGDLENMDVLEKVKALAPGSAFVADFGLVGGRVAFVKPDSPKQTAAILNYYDDQPQGRRGNDGEAFFVGDQPIDNKVQSVGRSYHGVFKNVLMQYVDCIEATQAALADYLKEGTYTLKSFVHAPLRAGLVRHLFHVDEYPEALNQALAIFTESTPNQAGSFSAKIFLMLQQAYYSKFFTWISEYRRARDLYINSSQQMLIDNADKILSYLRQYGQSDGGNRHKGDLIALSIVELVEEEIKHELQRLEVAGYDTKSSEENNPFNFTQKEIVCGFLSEITKDELMHYLTHPYIRTLPATVFAGEMLDNIIICGVSALAKDPVLLERLRAYLSEINFCVSDNGHVVKEKIDHDRLTGGLFYRFFLESLRLNSVLKTPDQVLSEMLLLRYGKDPAEISGLSLPGKSMIAIFSVFPRQDDRKFKMPHHFDPDRYFDVDGKVDQELEQIALDAFTKSKRYCPARQAATYEFYVMIAHLITSFDFKMEAAPAEVDPAKVNITLSARQQPSFSMALN